MMAAQSESLACPARGRGPRPGPARGHSESRLGVTDTRHSSLIQGGNPGALPGAGCGPGHCESVVQAVPP